MSQVVAPPPVTSVRRVLFVAGAHGPWRIDRVQTLRGDALPAAAALHVASEPLAADSGATAWVLAGVTSNERYVERHEKAALASRQQGLGRPGATCAALIPIRKTPAWWALPQDERRHILETQSRHIAIGLRYLPAIARRLHHCRDLETEQPFDFLTWFEYAPAEASAFDELLEALRASAEWSFVEREVDLRLVRTGG